MNEKIRQKLGSHKLDTINILMTTHKCRIISGPHTVTTGNYIGMALCKIRV